MDFNSKGTDFQTPSFFRLDEESYLVDNLKKPTDLLVKRKEEKIVKMSDKEIMDILKEQSLPTFGTKAERENRLRKAWGNLNDNSRAAACQRGAATSA